jgi:hypothetical protein
LLDIKPIKLNGCFSQKLSARMGLVKFRIGDFPKKKSEICSIVL